MRPVVPYAELHAHSYFSFLDGVSSPEALIAEATRLGLSAIAITDHDGLYGAVRFAEAAKEHGIATIFGAELNLSMTRDRTKKPDPDGVHLVVLASGVEGYRRLSGVISTSQLRGGQKAQARKWPSNFVSILAQSAGLTSSLIFSRLILI